MRQTVGWPCSCTGRAARAEMFSRSLCLLFLLWPVAGMAETYVIERAGYARDAATGALLYTEAHYERYQAGRIISDTVTYRDAAGEKIAVKEVDYRPALAMPDFNLINFKTGHREGAAREDGRLRVRFTEQAGAAEESAAILLPENGIIDAGFDQFVITRWDALIQGKRLLIKLLIPSMRKFIDFRIYQSQIAGDKRILHVEPDSLLFRVFAQTTVLEYAIDAPVLLSFKGISNMRDASGDNLQVMITFPREERLRSTPP